MYIIGMAGNVGTVYTEDDFTKGKIPNVGTRGLAPASVGSGTQEFILCKSTTAQNITRGMICTVSASYVATICPAAGVAPTARQMLAVACCTTTCSISQYLWCQIWGVGQVLASAATNANVVLMNGVVAGTVGDTVASLSAVISGLFLTASAGASQALTACILNYPQYEAYH